MTSFMEVVISVLRMTYCSTVILAIETVTSATAVIEEIVTELKPLSLLCVCAVATSGRCRSSCYVQYLMNMNLYPVVRL